VIGEPRLTHIALPVNDLTASVEWYERYTPLRAIDAQREPGVEVAWLCHPEPAEHPFVIVLVSVEADKGTKQGQLGPTGHLGIELPTRDAVDAMAVLARADGCLAWGPQQEPPPIGYVCAITDPDGNTVEFGFDQGIYAIVHEVLGSSSSTTD
jgi:catechol 2,3-dioxygenase-like lactoylglutathione lyase family enzyme